MLYPLRFEPIFRRYIWGGRRLGSVLHKSIDDGNDYAESWEIVDHGMDQSIVAFGPEKGKTLNQLVREDCMSLLGMPTEQFPLLFKFLDCNRKLSVQVHPNDRQAAQLTPPDLGKTEAWVILDAEPDSVIYAGLKEGVDAPRLHEATENGTVEDCLNQYHPRIGDCIFIQAGTVHALGSGLLVAEIQQASDTTFRLFDWNRVDANGNARPLHIQQAFDVIDFDGGPVSPQVPGPTSDPDSVQLVDCEKFILERWSFCEPKSLYCQGQFRLLVVLEGSVHVERDPSGLPLEKGHSMLVPADCVELDLVPSEPSTLLIVRPPAPF